MEWAIEGLGTLISASADIEFRTAMGILNFALTLVVFVTYVALFVTRVAVAAYLERVDAAAGLAVLIVAPAAVSHAPVAPDAWLRARRVRRLRRDDPRVA